MHIIFQRGINIYNNIYDVIIIGSGPSGATAAKYLSKYGMKVLIIEKKKEIGVPIQCAGFIPSSKELKKLMPSLEIPNELINIPKKCIYEIIKSQKIYFSNKYSRIFNIDGFIVDRKSFDQNLVELACNNGSELFCSTKAISINSNYVITNGLFGKKKYYGKVIIGADGPNSIVRQFIKKKLIYDNKYKIKNNYYSCFQYKMTNVNINEHQINIFFSNKLIPNGYAWIFPESINKVSVGLGIKINNALKRKSTKYYLDNFIKGHSIASKILRNGKITSVHTGFVPIYNFERSVYDNKLLVGDAASHVMATNGGGIPYSIIGGKIAARSIYEFFELKKPLEKYEQYWKEQYGKNL